MFSSNERFPPPKEAVYEGGRGPSSKRLAQSTSSLVRRGLFGTLEKHRSIDQGELASSSAGFKRASQLEETPYEELKKAQGKLCYICGAMTMESGTGLRHCPECRSLQLKSGMTSNAYARKHPDGHEAALRDGVVDRVGSAAGSRSSSKRSAGSSKERQFDREPLPPGMGGAFGQVVEDAVVDSGMGGSLSAFAQRRAWRRVSEAAHAEMATKTNLLPGETFVNPEDRVPIMAGYVETGFFTGDRVKTGLRLPGACPSGIGWDPINGQTNEGSVIGEGLKPGEIMVKFDAGGHSVSMKMSQLEHVKKREPKTHVERSRCRKSLVRATTVQ